MDPWLVEPRFRELAPDRYNARCRPERVKPIEAVIWHFTGPGSPAGARRWLSAADENFVSAHFIIDRDGSTWQLVPIDERAIHAGGNSSSLFGLGNVNGRTIGVELCNVGPLKRTGAGGWADTMGRSYTGAVGFVIPTFSAWEPFDSRQIDAACALARKLTAAFPVLATDPTTRHIGHQHVDPLRKIDPGPLFPWPLIRAASVLPPPLPKQVA